MWGWKAGSDGMENFGRKTRLKHGLQGRLDSGAVEWDAVHPTGNLPTRAAAAKATLDHQPCPMAFFPAVIRQEECHVYTKYWLA